MKMLQSVPLDTVVMILEEINSMLPDLVYSWQTNKQDDTKDTEKFCAPFEPVITENQLVGRSFSEKTQKMQR